MNFILDSLIFIFIITLAIRGYYNGIIEEFGYTFGLIVTILISMLNYQKLSEVLNKMVPLESWISTLISFIGIFLISLVITKIIVKAIQILFVSQHNIWMNNLLGSITGVVKGIVLVISLIWFIDVLPLDNWTYLIERNSKFARKSVKIKLLVISIFNWDDSVIKAESYLKEVTQP
tara:strand:- start:844 stop:1371 length:528 start_codon:yes stop_codon:yes gene_type:complete